MYPSDSSDDEEYHLEYWNNWIPSKNETYVSDNANNYEKSRCNTNQSASATNVCCEKFNNWIPPKNIFKMKRLAVRADESEKNKKVRVEKEQSQEILHPLDISSNFCEGDCKWKKILHLNWGKRVELHDVSNLADGSLFWGLVNLGTFSSIKLWINDYGNICGSAEGKVSKIGSSETSFISITDTKLLQKMLNISNSQWASLCEMVQLSKTSLKFDAFKDFDVNGKSSLQKLWFFICKRRHFFVEKCMLVKLSGAVKCLQLFKITPKLIVQDIKNIDEK